MIICAFKILKNFEHDKETALRMFFLKDSILDSIRILAYTAVIFSVLSMISIINVEDIYFGTLRKIGIITLFFGFTNFLYTVSQETAFNA